MSIILTCDHGGFELKEKIKKHITNDLKLSITDVGAQHLDPMDGFPPFLEKGVQKVLENKDNIGIFICGTGVAMSMAANRHKGIRAALCHSTEYAILSREHNNANVLCLGGRFLDFKNAKDIISVFLNTKYLGGKYEDRMITIDN